MRKFIKDFLGIPLSDSDDQLMQQMEEQQGQQGIVPPQPGGPTQSAATEGLTQKNRPQMSKLPLSNTGGGLSGG